MSATSYQTLTFVGVPTYTETTGGELDVDDFGMDVLMRKFEVRPDSIAVFMAAYPKNKQDTTYPWMYVTELRITDLRGPMAKGTVVFRGSILPASSIPVDPNKPRKELIKGGLQLGQVTLYAVDVLTLSKDITYRAPWTEWRYVTKNFPGDIGPAHPGEIISKNKVATIISAFGVAGAVAINPVIIPPGAIPATPTNGAFNGILKVNGSKFDYEQVGSMWTVLERNELIVVDFATFFINNYFNW